MNKFVVLTLAGVIALTLGACSAGNGSASSGSAGSSAGEPDNVGGDTAAYIVDVAELDATVHPDEYPLIPASDFETGFEKLKAANLSPERKSYQDIAELFGVDGAYYQNNDFDAGGEIFKYYGWYSEDDRSVLITFKVEADSLKYHAYASLGIS